MTDDPRASCDYCGAPNAPGHHSEGWWSFRCDPSCQPVSREIPRSEEYEEWRSKWRDFYERHRGEKWLTEEQFYAEAYQEGYEEGFERGFQRAATRAAPPSEGKAPSND